MADEKGTLRGDVEEGEEPVVAVTGSAHPGKQAEEEEEEPMKVGVAVGADACSDDLSCGEADIDPSLLELVDEEKCRSIRKQYRQLIYNVQQNRDDIVNTASDSLTEALEEANVLFDAVSRTREAALDAQFLVLASDLGKEKAKQLNSDMSFFNQVAFCDFLFIFVGLNWMEGDGRELSDYDDNIALSFWETVQKEATSWMLQAEKFHFIFGSFKSEPSARKPRLEHRKKVHRMEENGDMPTKLRKLDLNSNQEATEKEVERILGLLQTYFRKYPDTPVSYFEFVIDPNSFSRTVENIFYVSFIIRDGFARIRLDQDRLPILEPININQTVRVVQSCPRGCWLPLVLPSVPEPSSVPAPMPGGSHSAAPPPPPSSTAPPSASQAGCPTDSKLCLLPLTSNGRQEKNGQSGLSYQEDRLQKLQKMNGSEDLPESYDYDLIIIGGGSGGLAAAKARLLMRSGIWEAAKYNKKVMVLDFVTPTPLGTRWGLGGTCVNVGCIPKKLMHQAALLGQALRDSRNYGWNVEETVKHDWERMTEAVQNHIGSLNWGYRVALREKKVTYENAYGQFVGPHKIKTTNNKGREKIYSAEKFLIATGERPRYLDIPGDREYCISSDDLFSLPYCPGKTLVVGASYVALECAGFLAGIGLDVTVMVRSILLRGFDQDMANRIGEHMAEHGVKFIRQFVPIKVEQIEAGTPGRLRVVAKSTNGDTTIEEEYNTKKTPPQLIAGMCFESFMKTGKIPVTDEEQTNVPYIYAIGDVLEGKVELTPVAIQAGRLLARRLYAGSTVKCDYENVPTTVFTPLEYGACGLSEEKAVEKFGEENIEERVVGFHMLGPNAGEVTQGFAAALKCGLTKDQLDSTIGIHPVCAEVFTTLSVTKRSGGSILQAGC
ncbi:thioredoxin reductase 1, cytoplasmic isoform 3 [Camelus ferus]|nr:thioredoxin reductase 1, cytoplasmic isoform 3 [Camelus ferus]